MPPFENRKIFGPYNSGDGMVFADPIRVHRRLNFALDGDANKVIRDSRSEDPIIAFQAREKLIPAAIFAFEMRPFNSENGQGVLEEDVLPTLKAYLEYMAEKKAAGLISPTYLQPSQAFGPPSAEVGPSTTTPMYPFGVISGDCGCNKRGQ